MKPGAERTKLEKDVMAQRQTFSQKAQAFEQDRARRSNEERGKLVTRIQTAVQSVAKDQTSIWWLTRMPLHITAAM